MWPYRCDDRRENKRVAGETSPAQVKRSTEPAEVDDANADSTAVVSHAPYLRTSLDNPFISFYFFVTRRNQTGQVVGPLQRITREEALRLLTVNYAYTTYDEGLKGSIQPGILADFLILSNDLPTVPDDQILSVHPLASTSVAAECLQQKAAASEQTNCRSSRSFKKPPPTVGARQIAGLCPVWQ
jgi:hypothetical protein